jgi:uncharacterized NAD(P)/FAD-binding protein YdhS
MSTSCAVPIAIIGAGPRGIGVVERFAANLPELAADVPLLIHLIDPHPVGAGRIWRRDQSPLLKLNSMAEDVTMFTDGSSVIEGPITPGPSLVEWADLVASGDIVLPPHSAEVAREIATLTGNSFPTRQLQSHYLEWFARRSIAALPATATVEVHESWVSDVQDAGDKQVVTLENGEALDVDIVLYALGHTGIEPDASHRELIAFAREHGLGYVPPDFTADADTTTIPAGEPVIVRGMGLASVDLVVLLTEGRGGRFVRNADGDLDYLASGAEPLLYLGSRRGVPYHSKIASKLVSPRVAPRFFTAEIAAELESTRERLSFRDDVFPLIAKEMLWGYYHELFTGHPDRVDSTWAEFAQEFDTLAWDEDAMRELVEITVPDPADRLDLSALDRPLAGRSFASRYEFQQHLRGYIATDLHLRSAPEHSATLALFYSLLFSLFDLGTIIDSPKWTARSRVEDLAVWWLNYFSCIASGPPAHRLEEWLALSRAGVLAFLGPELRVRADGDGYFAASSPAVPGEIIASVLIDARLPTTRIGASDNPALRSLVESGAGSEEYLRDDDGFGGTTGRLEVRRSDARLLDSAGQANARRFAIGPYTNAPFVGAFSRPNTNAVSFRENDRVARAIIELASQLSYEEAEAAVADA